MRDKYDREKIKALTKHPLGCKCCWCGLGEAAQDFERASKIFRNMPSVRLTCCLREALSGRKE